MSSSAQPGEDNPLIGHVVQGRYKILGVLGQGGMGTVYAAEHIKIGRKVAIKTLLPELAQQEELLERFQREAQAASQIGHENIVDVTDMGEFEDGSPFLVMEQLQGEELAEYIEERPPLGIAESVKLILPVCSALQAAHDAGIVHRDLKPANIFLVRKRDGSVMPKILDFGISKFNQNVDDNGLTATGIAMGTPTFMSSEQAQGLKTLGHPTDQYAIGVILYLMLSGQLPFMAEGYAALLLKVMVAVPDHLLSLRPDLPEHFAEIVMKAFAREPKDRFEDMAALAEALAPYLDHVAPAAPAARIERPRAGSKQSDRTEALSVVSAAHSDPRDLSPETPAAEEAVNLPVSPWGKVGAGLAALGLVAGLGAFMLLSSDGDAEQATSPAESAPGAISPQLPDSQAPTPSAENVAVDAELPTEVRVRIRVVPASAQIFIGDVRFPNPMDAHQTRALTPISLRVEAEGYHGIERLVIFDEDQSFDFELSSEAEAETPAAARAASGTRSRRRAQPQAPEAAPQEESPAPSGGDEPQVYRTGQGSLRREF